MAPLFHNHTPVSTDWRQSLRSNNRKTYIVITLFFVIYLALGLLIDLSLSASQYPQASLKSLLAALLTFRIFPIATVITLCIAGVSLLISYIWYDKLVLLGTDYKEITPETAKSLEETQLYNVVEELKIAAGLRFMPRVFIINADYMNAFASGYIERSALVAITRGLMQKLNREECQAVMAHELSHIRHLDIKLTLTASLLANLIVILLDVLFYNMIFSNRREQSRNSLAPIILLLRYLLPVINILLLLYLSRTREYMADAGCVALMRDNQSLGSALLKIQKDYTDNQEKYAATYSSKHENIRREAYLFDPKQAGVQSMSSLSDLFSTHPSIQSRLAAIGFQSKDKTS